MKRLYENTFIVRPDLSPGQVESLADKFSKILGKEGGEVGKIEYCGLLYLAYPIKKNAKGHYVLMNITAEPAALKYSLIRVTFLNALFFRAIIPR